MAFNPSQLSKNYQTPFQIGQNLKTCMLVNVANEKNLIETGSWVKITIPYFVYNWLNRMK